MARKKKSTSPKSVEAITHEEATRKNIPTAEYQVGDAEGRTIAHPRSLREA